LLDGFLTLRSSCDVCGLDFNFADASNGPAIFVIMIAGAIVVGAALVTEVKGASSGHRANDRRPDASGQM